MVTPYPMITAPISTLANTFSLTYINVDAPRLRVTQRSITSDKISYARARKLASRSSNYNDAKQRKRNSRTSKIQTRRTMDNMAGTNKQLKNPLPTTRIQRHRGNNINTININKGIPRSVRKPNTPTTKGRALKCECALTLINSGFNETTPKQIVIHLHTYPTTSSCIQPSNTVNATWTTLVHFKQYTKIKHLRLKPRL